MRKICQINVYNILKKEASDGKTIEEYIGTREVSNIEEKGVSFCKFWWEKEILEDEINYYSLLQIKLYYMVISIVKIEKFLAILIKENNKSSINVCIRNLDEWRLLKRTLKAYKGKFKLIRCFKNKEICQIKGAIKNKGFEYITKYLSEITIKETKEISNKNIIVQEVNNNSMIKEMEQLERVFQNDISFSTMTLGKAMHTKVSNKKKFVIAKKRYLINIISIRNKMKKILYKSSIIELLNKFIYENHNLKSHYDLYSSYIYSYCINELTGLGLYKQSIESIFNDNDIKKIFLPSDSHAISRLICMIAKKNNIKTYVLQHGSIGELAFTPVYANYFLGWGEQAKDFLVKNGESKDKVHIVGNIKYSKLDYKENYNQLKEINNILWAVNPIGDEINISLFNILDDYLKRQYKTKLVIKLHPGDDNSLLYEELINKSSNKDRIQLKDRNSDIKSLIESNDLIVITQSTTGLEAIMMKHIVALYMHDAIPNIIEYSGFKSVIEFSNSNELINELNNLDIEKLQMLNINCDKLVKHYMEAFDKTAFENIIKV